MSLLTGLVNIIDPSYLLVLYVKWIVEVDSGIKVEDRRRVGKGVDKRTLYIKPQVDTPKLPKHKTHKLKKDRNAFKGLMAQESHQVSGKL